MFQRRQPLRQRRLRDPQRPGYRLRAAWRNAGLADGVLLSPVMSRAHDVKVWSADGLFNEGLRYVAELGWTNTFCGTCNNARDRDFVSLSAGLRF